MALRKEGKPLIFYSLWYNGICKGSFYFFSHNGHFFIYDVSTACCWSLIGDGVNLLCGTVSII